MSMIGEVGDVWRFVEFLKTVVGSDVISTHFKWDCTRIEGSDRIRVEKHRPDPAKPEVWYYEVQGLDDYTFLRFPVIQSGVRELLGRQVSSKNAEARFWRWVPEVVPGVIYGAHEPANALVDFIVIGYRPKALIKSCLAPANRRCSWRRRLVW